MATDDPWQAGESDMITATTTCPPGFRIIRDRDATVYTSSLTFEELGIDPEKVRKFANTMPFLSIDSIRSR